MDIAIQLDERSMGAIARVSIMRQYSRLHPLKLDAGEITMPLPEEVHRRLAARAVTDLDVAILLEAFTKETVSEHPVDRQVVEDKETRNF
jgi:hypothetical protein